MMTLTLPIWLFAAMVALDITGIIGLLCLCASCCTSEAERKNIDPSLRGTATMGRSFFRFHLFLRSEYILYFCKGPVKP